MNWLDNALSSANSFLISPTGKALQSAIIPQPKPAKPAPVAAPVAPANVPEKKMSQGMIIGLAAGGVAIVGLLAYAMRGK